MPQRFRARLVPQVLLVLLLSVTTFCWPSTASEDYGPLAKPSGPVILTVTGSIAQTNAPGRAEFDLAMLEALGVETLTTTTSWTDGRQIFEGIRASKLLKAVGAEGTAVDASALNDYVAEIPIDLLRDFPVLFAVRQNGVAMTARDKGPVWLVFPRDDYPELNDPRIDIRWVWQLKSINVR